MHVPTRPAASLAERLIANRQHSRAATVQSRGSGFNGRDVPATLHRVFLDPALPPRWMIERDPLVAASHIEMPVALEQDWILG
jgi:hypothetical protein